MLQIRDLSKKYHAKNHGETLALQNINLEVSVGEVFGVIGKSGAGKSTLLRCANLLETPNNGKVFVDGTDLTILSTKELRKHRKQIGMIFQHFNLLESRTAYENVALPLELDGKNRKYIDGKVRPLLELVNLSDRSSYYPCQLSGGQKQRVAIARALITDPKLLLCDEPTSALDPESTASILQLLRQINHKLNLTILLITHEMSVIKNICDRVAILNDGSLVEQGNVIDIFTAPKSEITKALTKSVLHLELPTYLQNNLHPEYAAGLYPILQLTFVGSATNEPIIATLLRRFNVTVSILQADLESIHGAAIGFLICKLIGDENAAKDALHYLVNSDIKVEVIGYE